MTIFYFFTRFSVFYVKLSCHLFLSIFTLLFSPKYFVHSVLPEDSQDGRNVL